MADDKLSIYHRYWIYSKTEADRIKKVADGMSGSHSYELGKVFTDNGVLKNYTSIVTDVSKIIQADSVIVMQGDIRKVNYKAPIMY